MTRKVKRTPETRAAQGKLRTRFTLLPPDDLHPHERTVPEKVAELARALEHDGAIIRPVVVDEETLVVLDGHHRLAALRKLGCRQVPVILVDYSDPSIVVATWREGEVPPTKEAVLLRALAGDVFEPKSTRHPVLNGLGHVKCKLTDLR